MRYQVSGTRARGAGTRESQVINRCRVSNLVFGSGRWRHRGQLPIPERPTRLLPLGGTYLICTWSTTWSAFARALVASMLARCLSPVACHPLSRCLLLDPGSNAALPLPNTHAPTHPNTQTPPKHHPNTTQTRLCSSSLTRTLIRRQPCTGRCPLLTPSALALTHLHPRRLPRRSLLPTCPTRPSDVSALLSQRLSLLSQAQLFPLPSWAESQPVRTQSHSPYTRHLHPTRPVSQHRTQTLPARLHCALRTAASTRPRPCYAVIGRSPAANMLAAACQHPPTAPRLPTCLLERAPVSDSLALWEQAGGDVDRNRYLAVSTCTPRNLPL
jgi:hypothetical protein